MRIDLALLRKNTSILILEPLLDMLYIIDIRTISRHAGLLLEDEKPIFQSV